ncbi:MAG: Ig-like domain-containing protein [candidate division KSB1 bacterium]|nr:Ig-like domain-containing protein [candidate division KSB1 bacterium]
MNGLRKASWVLMFLLLGAWHVQAQFSVTSITPSHGTAQVPQNTSISIVFNQPIDQSGQYIFDENGEPVNWRLYPDTDETLNSYTMISSDGKTFTLVNLSLKANTQYTFVVEGAFAADGTPLSGPAVVMFTTGDGLPDGRISGSVSGTGVNFQRVLVNVFVQSPFNDFFFAGFAVPDNSGNYSVPYLPAGSYYVIATYDSNGNGVFDPGEGDWVGGYDPNGDKLVDAVNVNQGQSVDGVHFAIQSVTPATARTIFQVVAPFVATQGQGAGGLASDPALISIFGPQLNADGQAYIWGYGFYSAAEDKRFGFFATQNLVVPALLFAGDTSFTLFDTLKTPLPDNWMDSDAAMTVVKNAGAADFLQKYPDADISAFGATFDPDSLFRFESGESLSKSAQPQPRRNRQFVRWQTRVVPNKALSPEVYAPFWIFIMDAKEAEEFLSFFIAAVNMLTAETTVLSPAFGVARSNLQTAKQFASTLVSDASLVGIMTPPFFGALQPDGQAIFWAFVFYSASADSFFQLMMSNSRVFGVSGADSFVSKQPLPDTFMDSDEALAKAEARGGADFRQNNPGAIMTAWLAYGLYPQDPSLLVWMVQYGTYAMPQDQWLTFIFDAITGDVLVNVEESGNRLPEGFQIHPVYPNPQQAGGRIHIPLTLQESADVEIVLYNLLGQVVRTVQYGRLTSGSHTLRMQDLLQNLSVGAYFVQVKLTRPNGQIHRLMRRIVVQ